VSVASTWRALSCACALLVIVAVIQPVSRAQADTTHAEMVGFSNPGWELMYESQAALDTDLTKITSTGAAWLRIPATWSEIEGSQGQPNWSNIDRVNSSARQRGLKTLLTLGGVPGWVNGGRAWNYAPQSDPQRAAFAQFASAAATRYRGHIDALEIWNEPNLLQSWTPSPDIASYTALLRQAFMAIKVSAPEIPVVAGGTGWSGGSDISSTSWYRGLYANGGRGYFDAANDHPYPDFSNIRGGEMGAALQIRSMMDANGDSGKQLWATEFGAPTGGDYSYTSEANQASLIRQGLDLWTTVPNHGPMFVYALNDSGGSSREGYFGVLHSDGSPKPAYGVLQSWIGTGTPPPPPPANGALTNGGFETGNLSGWAATGPATGVTSNSRHSGNYAASLGSSNPTDGDSNITQTFAAPTGAQAASFWYQITCPDTVKYDWATASLKDDTTGATTTVLPPTCTNDSTWRQANTPVIAGHRYTLTLTSHDDNYAGDATYVRYDDVTFR
jgi:hypothetical protein